MALQQARAPQLSVLGARTLCSGSFEMQLFVLQTEYLVSAMWLRTMILRADSRLYSGERSVKEREPSSNQREAEGIARTICVSMQ